ncbi:MAG: response regulator, partial [Leadbetterella sp.]|nr:response regulator [Leadbetterella sp.]
LTCFQVFFPFKPGTPPEIPARRRIPEEEDEWPAHEVTLPDAADPEKQTLLLVEDNPEVRELIRDLFISHYTIEEAANGEEGWQKAQKISPDLIISDIMMPVMDGIELCRRIKTDIKTSHIPVILLTARATIAYKYEGYETGADAYITKPFSGNYLLLRVKNLIRQRNTLRLYLQRESFFDPGTVIVNTLDDRILRKAKEYVEARISDTSFTIEEMSRELGLSRMHFHRKIKSLTGLAPAEFVRNIRLRRAAAILQQNNVSVKETMVMVGL